MGEGTALNRLPGAFDSAAVTEGAAEGRTAALGVAGPEAVGEGEGVATASGTRTALGLGLGLGQAVRLAGAPASTGTAVGRTPHPVAVISAAASSTARAETLRTFTWRSPARRPAWAVPAA